MVVGDLRAAHIANLIGGDARAFAQAVIVCFAGYFFYLIRRVSGRTSSTRCCTGCFDFTILTGTQIIPDGEKGYPGAFAGRYSSTWCAASSCWSAGTTIEPEPAAGPARIE